MTEKKRILTGDRPTGKLHLGHYVGTVANRIRLQHEYESILSSLICICDNQEHARRHCHGQRKCPSSGIGCSLGRYRTGNVTFYLQSAIPEMHEIFTLFQNLVSVPRLERLPSLKGHGTRCQHRNALRSAGLSRLQAADILHVKAHLVPVGKDNIAHVEITREIARQL